MDFQFEAALQGNLEDFQKETGKAWMLAARQTLDSVRDYGLARLRGSVIEAGLGQRLANTWRGDLKPERGLAWHPSLTIYSNAKHIISGQSAGLIRSGKGVWLAIPIPDGPADKIPDPKGPGTKVDRARELYGDRLFVIPAVPGRAAMLAVKGVAFTSSGKLRIREKTKRGQWGKGVMTVPLFWLVPQVTMKPALDPQADLDAIARFYDEEFQRNFADNIVRAGLGD